MKIKQSSNLYTSYAVKDDLYAIEANTLSTDFKDEHKVHFVSWI